VGFSPDHPDPACPDCHGDGSVPPPWATHETLIDRIPCGRCKAREYEAQCGGGYVTMTPGHPCADCGAAEHPRVEPCDHGQLPASCRICRAVAVERETCARVVDQMHAAYANTAARAALTCAVAAIRARGAT
jgi:hypothetical protein